MKPAHHGNVVLVHVLSPRHAWLSPTTADMDTFMSDHSRATDLYRATDYSLARTIQIRDSNSLIYHKKGSLSTTPTRSARVFKCRVLSFCSLQGM